MLSLLSSVLQAPPTPYPGFPLHFTGPPLEDSSALHLGCDDIASTLGLLLTPDGRYRAAWPLPLLNFHGSLGVGVSSEPESPTCWGLSRRSPNKLRSPTLWPCEIPKSHFGFVNLSDGGKSTTDVETHDVQPQAKTKRPFLTAGGVIIVYFFIRGTLPPHTQSHAFQVR